MQPLPLHASCQPCNAAQQPACHPAALPSPLPCRLAHSLSLRSSALEDFAEFAAGKSAAFPLLRPQPEHGAQHLLVDARLALPAAAADGMQAVAADADGKPGQEAAAAAFAEVAEMLQDALADAALLKGAPQQAPAVANGGSDSSSRRQAGEATEFFLCHDGYVAAVWHGDTAGLSGEVVQLWVE